MEQYTVYAYFDNKTGDAVYIGIAKGDGEERHQNHLKPSKYDVQAVNKWLQDNQGDWTYIKLGQVEISVDAKEAVHALETFYVGKYKPRLNVYKV